MFKSRVGPRLGAAFLLLVVATVATAGVNTWTPIDGLPGGLVHRIVHHPTRPEIVYLTSNSGLYRSVDAGRSWRLAKNQPRNWPYGIAVNPADPDRVYVGAMDGELMESSDAGVSFQSFKPLPFGASVTHIEISGDGTVLYAGGGTRIHRSLDAARTWQALSQTPTSSSNALTEMRIDPRNANVLVARFSEGQAFRTGDGGLTWQPFYLPPAPVGSLDISRTGPQKIWASTTQGAWFSDDFGANWTPASLSGRLGAIAIDPTNPATIYASRIESASVGLYRSNDDGAHWTEILGNLRADLIDKIALDPQQPNRLLVAGDAGLWSTSDGGVTWVAGDSGISSSVVYRFSVVAGSDRIYMGVATGGMYFVGKGEPTAQPVNNEARRLLAPFPTRLSSSSVLAQAGSVADRLFVSGPARSQDSGATWTSLAPVPYYLNSMTELAASPTDRDVILAGSQGGGVFRSADGGDHWSGGIGLPLKSEVFAVATSGNVTPVAYASVQVSDERGIVPYGVYKSLDSGQNWMPTKASVGAGMVRDIAIDPASTETVYAATHLGLMKTNDGGGSWSTLPTPASDLNITAVTVDPLHPAIVYVAANGSGSYYVGRSVDSGATWEELRRPGERAIGAGEALICDPQRPHLLLMATNGFGVQQLHIEPDLSLAVATSTATVLMGTTATSTYTLRNEGPYHATGATTTIRLPQSATDIAATTSAGTCSQTDKVVTCTQPVLKNGQTVTLTVAARYPTAGSFETTASIEGQQPDDVAANNTAKVATTVSEPAPQPQSQPGKSGGGGGSESLLILMGLGMLYRARRRARSTGEITLGCC